MACVNITINGRKIEAQPGQSVLAVAEANGIYIPTLCHHPAIQAQGSCRMCLVEIEKQRSLQPACTFPVSEGMVVHTASDKVVSARKFILDLLFSERIHYCMYCTMTGPEGSTDCDLQRLAYEHGMTNWKYAPNTKKRWPVDASRQYFVMDHSRCILCRRCIRACDEVVANHTLGVRDRGARTMVIADDDVPFGSSSCVSCGTCLQVCPTGALMDRRSAYMGRHTDVERTEATCLGCAIGCGVEAVTRSNQLLRVEGDWDAANGGLLCVTGRFEPVEPGAQRVTAPMIKREGAWVDASWEEALGVVANRVRSNGLAAGLASPRATTENLAAFAKLFRNALGSDEVGLLYGQLPPLFGTRATLRQLSDADLVVVIGSELLNDHKVMGYIAKRVVDRGGKLVVVNDQATLLDPWAAEALPLAQVGKLPAMVMAAARPVVVYSAGLPSTVYDALSCLPSHAAFMPVYEGTNTAGAADSRLSQQSVQGTTLFVYAADEQTDGLALPAADFVVVQGAYRTALLDRADVVLPAQTWAEAEGHMTNVEGRTLPVKPVLVSPAGVQADAAVFAALAERLGHPLD
jgi:formate dehydrogenase major subunit